VKGKTHGWRPVFSAAIIWAYYFYGNMQEVIMMYGNLSLVKNSDDTYDLLISYSRHDTEFAMDFLSKPRVQESYATVARFLQEFARGLQIERAKIVAGSLVLAVMPLQMFLPVSTQRSMAYLAEGASVPESGLASLGTLYAGSLDLDLNGTLKPFDAKACEQAKPAGARVVPLLRNHWRRQACILALERGEALAGEIAGLLEEHALDGVQVALDNLIPVQRDAYVLFVSSLRQAVPEGKEVSVLVAANPGGWNWGWQGSYDCAELARHADYLMCMTCDQHYQGGDPGPVAGALFAEQSLRVILATVPPEQVVMGLPLYGRLWSADNTFSGQRVPLHQARELLSTCEPLVLFNERHQSPKAVFTLDKDMPLRIDGQPVGAGAYELWYEDEVSLRYKLALASRYRLKGVALNALGEQSESAWEIWREWAVGGMRGARQHTSATEHSGTPEPIQEARTQPPGVPTPAATLPQTACVLTPGAALHTRADKQSHLLTTLQRGTLVTLLGKSGDWFKVQPISGEVGYVAIADLHVHKAAVVTPCAGGRVMAAPRFSAQVMAAARYGEAVTLLEELEDGWCKIRSADKRVGYMRSRELARVSRSQPIVIKTATASLKLREQSSPTAGSRGILPEGKQALVLEEPRDGYAKVVYGGVTAYVTGGYLR